MYFSFINLDMDVWSLPQTDEEAVRLLQNYGILHSERTCKNGHDAKLYFGK